MPFRSEWRESPILSWELSMRTKSTMFCPRHKVASAILLASGRLPHEQTFPNAAILAVVLIATLTACSKKEAPQATPPEVEVTNVVQQDVPLYAECVSTLDGYVNAQIQPQVTGYLLSQNYREGTMVHKGQV